MKPTFENLVAVTAKAARLPKAATRRTLLCFFAELGTAVWATGRVNVPGLGAFRVRSRKPRRIAHPQTGSFGEVMQLPSMRVVVCRVSSSWRRRDG